MGMPLDSLKMESIGDCLEVEQSRIRYVLKRSIANAPCPDESLEDVRSSVALPRRIEEMRFGPACHPTSLIQ